MINILFQSPVFFIFFLVVLLISVGVHEFAHAITADRLGDPTARAHGRLTLNPLAHIDMVGLLFLVFWGFGWGKPVPYDPFNLRRPSRDAALIAAAGPVSSLLLALLVALFVRLLPFATVQVMLGYAVLLNLMLGIFNLLPIYPLDGFQIMTGLLPKKHRIEWQSLSRYGILILLLFLLPIIKGQSPLLILITPIVNFLTTVLLPGGII